MVLLKERIIAGGRVDVAGGVAIERPVAGGRVGVAGCVAVERIKTVGRVVVPVVLLKSATSPVAVL